MERNETLTIVDGDLNEIRKGKLFELKCKICDAEGVPYNSRTVKLVISLLSDIENKDCTESIEMRKKGAMGWDLTDEDGILKISLKINEISKKICDVGYMLCFSIGGKELFKTQPFSVTTKRKKSENSLKNQFKIMKEEIDQLIERVKELEKYSIWGTAPE